MAASYTDHPDNATGVSSQSGFTVTLTLPSLYTPASQGSHFGDLTPMRILKLTLTPWVVRTGLLLSWEFTWAQFPNLQRGFAFSDIIVHIAMSTLRVQHHLDGILFF